MEHANESDAAPWLRPLLEDIGVPAGTAATISAAEAPTTTGAIRELRSRPADWNAFLLSGMLSGMLASELGGLTGSKAALALADGTRRPRCRWLRRRRLIIFALPVLFDAHWHEPSMVAMELVLVAEAPRSLGAPSRSRAHDELPVVTCVAGVGRAGGCKAQCVAQAAYGRGDVHSTRHGGRRPGLAERVPGCGNAHTRAEPHDVLASILRVALVV